MKKLLFLLMLPLISFSQKKKTIFIEYFVPISNKVKKKYEVHNKDVDYLKYCSHIVGNYNSTLYNISSLSKNTKKVLYDNIFSRAKSGELNVYQNNNGFEFYGPSPDGSWIGEKKILNKNQIKNAISYYKIRDSIHIENGVEGPAINNNGDIIKVEYLEECKMDDFIGISFFEEWTIDYNNLVIDKNVLYYAPAIAEYNSETMEIVGYRNAFILENKKLKSKLKIKKDFYSNTEIFCDFSTSDSWFKNNLEPSVKYQFIKNLFEVNNGPFYDFSPPYEKQISKIDALSFESYKDSIARDDNGEFFLVRDESGNGLKVKINLAVMPVDINSFGFLEDWYFDEDFSSFKKEVKGISFEIIEYDPTHKDLISKPIFLKK